MGAIAEAMVEFARPLIDATDGSIEAMNRALSVSSLCYNLGCLPEEAREPIISEMKIKLNLNDLEFEEFKRSVITPMLQRYETMFGGRQLSGFDNFLHSRPQRPSRPIVEANNEVISKPDRYALCDCNSGLKYKFCCGKK